MPGTKLSALTFSPDLAATDLMYLAEDIGGGTFFERKIEVSQLDARYVNVSGDAMTGALSMSGFQINAVGAPTAGGDATNKAYVDGLFSSVSSPPFTDTNPLIKGSIDPTKLLRFEVDGFTAATTRVLTPQNADYTIAGINIEQTFTANQHIGALNVLDLNTDGSIYAATGGFTVALNGDVGIVSQVTLGTAGIWSDQGGVFDFAGTVSISPTVANVTTFSISGYSLTGASTVPMISLAGTWNTAGTPIAILLDILDTASGSASRFLDFRRSGVSRFSVDKFGLTTITYTGIGATPTDGLLLLNPTAATVGAQQYSPALRFTGQGWKTAAVAGSQQTDWRIYNQPVQGSTNPSSNLLFQVSINVGAFGTVATMNSSLDLIVTNNVQSTNVVISPTGELRFSTRSRIASSADGLLGLFNNALTGFTRLNFGGTTSSFPGITRSGAAFILTLADGTGSAAITTGNITMTTAALLSINSGTNQRAGNAVLVAGTVTVANTTVTANTIVMLTRKTSGGTIGTAITYTVSAGTSFTITSDSALDTSTFSYMLIEVP